MTDILERPEFMTRQPLDEITGMSRQRRWQLRKMALGRCVICGKPRGKKGTSVHCRFHADEKNRRVLETRTKKPKKVA